MNDRHSTAGRRRSLVLTLAAAMLGSVAVQSPAIGAPPERSVHAARTSSGITRTSALEARRTDRVPTPRPTWTDCSDYAPRATCAMVDLPLDYDEPRGPRTAVAVLRVPATDPARRIGTLFLNPGGPGGSGVMLAAWSPFFLSSQIRSRFDVLGFDPRGTTFSDNVRCWASTGERATALAGMSATPFPWSSTEVAGFVTSARAVGRACSRSGALAASVSTAQVARDMEVLRRMVGDPKLTYLGFSYGSFIGETYANLFPDRVRAVAVDGVLDPRNWTGTASSRPRPLQDTAGRGSITAMRELMRRCGAAGPDRCAFAGRGNPTDGYREIMESLRAEPLVLTDDGGGTFTLTYPTVIGLLLYGLRDPYGFQFIDLVLTDLHILLGLDPGARRYTPARSTTAQRAAAAELSRTISSTRETRRQAREAQRAVGRKVFGRAFPYDNGVEAFYAVLCTDGRDPKDVAAWTGYAAELDRVAPGFGPAWGWSFSPCAARNWTADDEDAYSGPFTARTAHAVLVVGSRWDPATSYLDATTTVQLMPNSRLLTSDSWGHTAFGTSDCVTTTIERYLLTLKLPAPGTTCVGDVQPFSEPTAGEQTRQRAPKANRPPVDPPLPPLGWQRP